MQVGLRAAAALKPRALGVRTLATSNGKEYLPWETCTSFFFAHQDLRLRNQRRIAGLVSTVPAMILAGAASGSYFLTQELDPSQTIMGVRRRTHADRPPVCAHRRDARLHGPRLAHRAVGRHGGLVADAPQQGRTDRAA